MIPGLSPRFNRRNAVLVTAPAVEPVLLADVKAFLKVDASDEDSLISTLIATARRMAEEYTRRSFLTQTWALTQDSFSNYTESLAEGYMVAPTPQLIGTFNAIHLPRGPIQSVTSIKVFNSAGVQSTVDPVVYSLDAVNGDVLLNNGQSWPTDLRDYSAVLVTYVAGYTAAVPVDLQQAVLMQAAALYEGRGCTDITSGVAAILDPYRLPEAFGVW